MTALERGSRENKFQATFIPPASMTPLVAVTLARLDKIKRIFLGSKKGGFLMPNNIAAINGIGDDEVAIGEKHG